MAESPRSIWTIIKGRCLFLLVSLFVLLLLYPSVHESAYDAIFMLLLNSAVLVAGVHAVSSNHRQVVIAVAIAVPQLLTAIIAYLLPPGNPLDAPLSNAAAILLTVFYGFTLVMVAAYVMRPGQVSRDKIYGAISIYLLAGLAWSQVYALVEGINPGSFTAGRGDLDFIYFSYTTLTTLGYGDIAPVTARARSLTTLEAVTGVMFMATAIARLISLYRPEVERQSTQEKVR